MPPSHGSQQVKDRPCPLRNVSVRLSFLWIPLDKFIQDRFVQSEFGDSPRLTVRSFTTGLHSPSSTYLRLRGGEGDESVPTTGAGYVLGGTKIPKAEIRTLPQIIPPPEMRDFAKFVTRSDSYSALDETTVTANLAGPAPTQEEQIVNMLLTGQTEAQAKPEAYIEKVEAELGEIQEEEDQQLRVVIISSEVPAPLAPCRRLRCLFFSGIRKTQARAGRSPLGPSPAASRTWRRSSPSPSARRATAS